MNRLFFSPLSLCLTAIALLGLAYPHNSGPGKAPLKAENPGVRPAAMVVPDTIPFGEKEDFDLPLGNKAYEPHDPAPFESQDNPALVIPNVKVEVDTSFYQARKLPEQYTGFKIEIMKVEAPLPESHDIFFQHGRLIVEKLADNSFSYLLGDFDSEDEATVFMQDFLLGRYPDARVARYEEGERLY